MKIGFQILKMINKTYLCVNIEYIYASYIMDSAFIAMFWPLYSQVTVLSGNLQEIFNKMFLFIHEVRTELRSN